MAKKEDLYLIRCERIVNESWGQVGKYYGELEKIIEQGGPQNDFEESIVLMAANATLQQLTLEAAEDIKIFEQDPEDSIFGLVPSGKDNKCCDDCDLE